MENTHIPGIQPSLDRRSIPQEFTTVSMTFDEMIRRMTGSCKSKDRGDGIQKEEKMKKEQIEQAAARYAESIAQSDIKKGYSIDDFMAGAEWRISSAWHNAGEQPEGNKYCLLEYGDGYGNLFYQIYKTTNVTYHQWLSISAFNHTTRWAYIDDLIPEL